MALYNSGAGATVSGTSHLDPQGPASLERAVFGMLARLEEEENILPRIAQRTDRISIQHFA
jgi:hypothetical protein